MSEFLNQFGRLDLGTFLLIWAFFSGSVILLLLIFLSVLRIRKKVIEIDKNLKMLINSLSGEEEVSDKRKALKLDDQDIEKLKSIGVEL
ncbi:MAG: hypothetical protein JSV31_15355 [Desulfobacterales bacterium]|nr:MAG: hypothetical protein JSV31_15355 [Desulfobacterales bacterium]